MRYLADLIKPVLTLLVTVFLIAVIAATFHPPAHAWIVETVPAFANLDPFIAWLRDILGLAPEERPWWKFW